MYGQLAAWSGGASGSTKANGWSGKSARRTATSAIDAGPGRRLVDDPGGQRADRELRRGRARPPARARRRAAGARARGRCASPGSDGIADRRSGATTSDPAPITRIVPARRWSRWAKAWSERARSGSTPVADDLGHRVGLDEVDPLEGRDDRVLGRPQGGRGRGEADVAPALGGETVGEAAQLGEGALAAGRAPARPARDRSAPGEPRRGATRGPPARRPAAARRARGRSGPRSG